MKSKLLALVTPLVAIMFATGVAAAQGQYISGSTGVDVSWPNCSASIPKTGFGIVGVTGGKNFSQNSCLKAEAAHFSNLSLYVNTGYPGQGTSLAYQNTPQACGTFDLNCVAYNYGYNAGIYAFNYAESQGVSSDTWWLDVETMNTWSSDIAQNRSSLQGEFDALKDAGIGTIGVYSTTYQWGVITGGWQNNLPSWGATTWTTAKQAAKYCKGHEFTGGPSYLMQYTPKRSLDQDVAC
jgi:hypothetical protein